MKLLKNKEVQKLVLGILIFILVLGFLFISVSYQTTKEVRNLILNNNVDMINTIIKKYPNSEKEIINIVINNHYNSLKDSSKELKKYGISDKESLDSITYLDELKNDILFNNFLLLITIVIILSIILYIFLKRIYIKINTINEYTTKAINDSYQIDIIENYEGDISILKNNIYKIITAMKEQKQTLADDKLYLKDTLSDISHQIKTPLTSLNIINDLLYQDLNKKDKIEFLDKMHYSLEKIEWLVKSLLKLSQLDSKTIVLQKDKIIVRDLITSSLEPLLIPIELKNQDVILKGNKEIKFIGDFNWTKEALTNIIKNSVEHTKENGQISIEWSDNPIYTEIIIKDNGEGINKSDLPFIFDRFYKAKGSSKESIGIGLAMAKQIINNQNGDITVRSKLGEYTSFSIKMYKYNS